MAAKNDTAARKAVALQRQQAALELRRAGRGFKEIAHQLGISTSGAHRTVAKALAECKAAIDVEAADLKALEISRLDGLLAGLWTDARRGNLGAVDRVLKIMERRAKLLGLDAPVKVANTNPAGDEERDPMRYVVPVPATMSIEEWLRQYSPTDSPPSG